jgi:methyl-accepting chemotaxis protein
MNDRARSSSIRNLSLGKKLTIAISVFVFPVMLMGYFLYVEKDDLISFTKKEIAGVHYLRGTRPILEAVTATAPTRNEVDAAVQGLRKAEQEDAGVLAVSEASHDLALAAQGVAEGKDTAGAAKKTLDLISAISDDSNITLDPDSDTYFVGDIIVNQAPAILAQTGSLISAARDLDKAKSDDLEIAYGEARDGAASAADNFASDFSKALKGNADGSVKTDLGEPAKAVADAVAKLMAAAKTDDRKTLVTAANDVERAVDTALHRAEDEMERLLRARIAGFHATVLTRLGIALLSLLLGGFICWRVVRSVTKPLNIITALMGELAEGKLDIRIPHGETRDEIGALIVALKAFHKAGLEREQTRLAERERVTREHARSERIEASVAGFEQAIGQILGVVESSASELEATANTLAETANETSRQSTAVAAASEHAMGNVQTVSSATEELSASIKEIAQRVGDSTRIVGESAKQATDTNVRVQRLKDSVQKIDTVVSLINDIASQTNLLALNATIEAARAGEAGKGFAVVASEVKALATQTAKATEEIAGQIRGIQEETDQSVEAIETITRTIEQVDKIASSIATAVEQQGLATQEIAHSVSQAADGTTEVSSNIVSVSKASKQTGAAASQVLSAARELGANGGALKTQVETFLRDVRAA